MKDIAGFANKIVERATKITGHTDEDWAILAACKDVTTPWAPELGRSFGKLVYAEDSIAETMTKFDQRERELSLAVWYEKLVSGTPSSAWWPETALIGFFHASAGIPNELVLAMVGHVEDFFLKKCEANMEASEAIKAYGAFRRILSVSTSLMIEAYDHAIITGICQLGFNQKLMNRMRSVAIKKMIDKGRDSLPMMTWDDSLSVNVAETDRQHKVLIDILNRLHQSQVGGKGNDALRGILDELVNYTVEHFGWEEKLLAEQGYPQLPAHIDAHEKLKARVVGFVADFNAGRASLGSEIFLFLRSWLNGHIRGSDRHYGRYLNTKGVF